MIKITRSYSRKLNLSKYGGNLYETSDFFSCWEEEIDRKRSSTKEGPIQISKILFKRAKEDVQEAIKEEIELLKKENREKMKARYEVLNQKQSHNPQEQLEFKELKRLLFP